MKKCWLALLFAMGMCCYVYAQEPTPRVVSAGGSVTEWVVALGAENELVGVDTTSSYPESIRKLPKIGYQRQLSAEGVASLKPTLVIGTPEMGPDTALKQLNHLGIRVETLSNDASFKALADNLAKLGVLLNKEEQANKLYQDYRNQCDQLEQTIQRARAQNQSPKVVLIMAMQGSFLAAGSGTTADWLIKQAGGNNVASFNGYKPISSEALLALNPNVIIIADRTGRLSAEAIKKMVDADSALALTDAAKKNKMIGLDATLLVAGLGPRLPDEAVRLASIFYDLPTIQTAHVN